MRVKTCVNLAVLEQFAEVLTTKVFTEYKGIFINGCVITLNNDYNGGIVGVASLLLARQYLSNSCFPNRHVDMVASIKGRHFVSCLHQYNLVCRFLPTHF